MSIEELQRRFGIPGVVRIDAGRNALPRLNVTSGLAEAEIYFHGAHLTRFQPRGGKPLLFMSAESRFEEGKPIRGGVPVIFPWFGPRAGAPDAPIHGLARIRPWELESCAAEADGTIRVGFRLQSDAESFALWPFAFELRMSFALGRSLEMELAVRNPGSLPFNFEEAFHTYLAVGDVRRAGVEGLEGIAYIDKVDGFQRKTQAREPVRISGETDRVYLNTSSACVVRDPDLGRSITVEKENSNTTVVWNPWIAKARAMADFGDEEWPGMICVETANAGESAIRLEGGGVHRMKARLSASAAGGDR